MMPSFPFADVAGRYAPTTTRFLDLDQDATCLSVLPRLPGRASGTGVTIAIRSFVVDSLRLRSIRRCLLDLGCLMALFLLGLPGPVHAHAYDHAEPQASIAASLDDDHCPQAPNTGASGQCHATTHAHACCILLVINRPATPVATPAWSLSPERRSAGVVVTPIPRPPASIVV